jgi:hypothetical protein
MFSVSSISFVIFFSCDKIVKEKKVKRRMSASNFWPNKNLFLIISMGIIFNRWKLHAILLSDLLFELL